MTLTRWRAGDPWNAERLNALLYDPMDRALNSAACSIRLSTAQNVRVSSTWSQVPLLDFQTQEWDTHGMVDLGTAPKEVLIPVSGLYEVILFVRFDQTGVTTTWWGTQLLVAWDGATWSDLATDRVGPTATDPRLILPTSAPLEAGARIAVDCASPSTVGTPKCSEAILRVAFVGDL